jgi:hypothetical protein
MPFYDTDPNTNVTGQTPLIIAMPQPEYQETKPAIRPLPFPRQRPQFRVVCKKIRVIDNHRLGDKRRFQYQPPQLGDAMFEELGDTDSVGASIGLSSEGAKASVGVSWSKVALIAIPVLYLGWTKVLKNKGFGLPLVG